VKLEDLDITPPGPPVADPGAFYGLLGDIVAAADPSTEADQVGVLGTLLAAAGAHIGPGPYVQIGNTRHPLLVWPLLFGRTGSGRKGEATDTALMFVRRASVELLDAITVGGLSSGEGLIERIRDPDESKEDAGGTDDKRLLVIEPEFSTVMARAKREGSTLASVLRQAWDGRALSVLNRRALRASGSHVTIVGHVTPKEFRLRLADSDMSGGTYNRFLPLWVERSKTLPFPDGTDPALVQKLAGELARAMQAARTKGQLGMETAARRLWRDELYPEMSSADDEDEVWTEFTRRAAPYCLRTAALYAALDDRQMMTAADLVAAAHLVRYSVSTAQYVLDHQSRNPRLDRIRRAVSSAGSDGLTRTAISALFSRNVDKAKLDQLLAELVAAGVYERFEVRTGGRPAEAYRRTTKEERTDPEDSEPEDVSSFVVDAEPPEPEDPDWLTRVAQEMGADV
jgi:hypothetical protein